MPVEKQPQAYASLLKGLIEDSNRRSKMKKACREQVMNGFTLEQSGDRFIQILHEVVENNQKANRANEALSSEELFLRNSQQIIEYLQSRHEWHKINNQIFDLSKNYQDIYQKYIEAVAPKPASFWFYLWIRQLFLPISNKIKSGILGKIIQKNQKWLKEKILKI
jgi:hypothetical protein